MSIMRSRVIAVAIDDGRPPDEGTRAMALALDLAVRADASILAVRIGRAAGADGGASEALSEALASAETALPGRLVVRHVRVQASPPLGVTDPDTASQAAGEAFVATAAGFDAGLLVVAAPNDLSPLDSVVGAIVGASTVPTVVVPTGVEHVDGDRFHVVVALDGVLHTRHVADQICELNGWFQTSVSLLHVLHPGGAKITGVSALAHDRAAQMLQRSAACLGECGMESGRVHAVVRSGPTSNVIVDHLRRERATLGVLPVVASTPGHRRPHGVTNGVLSMSHVPIVLFHA